MRELVLNLGSLLRHLCFNHATIPSFVHVASLKPGILEWALNLFKETESHIKVTADPLSSLIIINRISATQDLIPEMHGFQPEGECSCPLVSVGNWFQDPLQTPQSTDAQVPWPCLSYP